MVWWAVGFGRAGTSVWHPASSSPKTSAMPSPSTSPVAGEPTVPVL
eukprot:CAMPEP_0119535486 /NCGR_PEP_ID=MMETSP1344-20130328/48519_1 /TAXON_ID=236787 /ORGANISM="Florenciella parvula, Strain CCMP2471" /LENGTH=45 /DNA_ID= /DNA_START= /DNA_END= /DNA_ORIENTATION=